MLRFKVFKNGQLASDLDGSTDSRVPAGYLVDSYGEPWEKDISFFRGLIGCYAPSDAPRSLVLLWTVEGFGKVMVRTPLLYERVEPYNLNVELARGRYEWMNKKLTEWSANGFKPSDLLQGEIEKSGELLKKAVAEDEENIAARLADQSLAMSMWAGEKLALEFAKSEIRRRRETGGLNNFRLGCNIYGFESGDLYRQHFEKAFNYATVPFYWTGFEPEPGRCGWEHVDALVDWLTERGMRIKGHPLVWINKYGLPDWIYHASYEKIKDALRKRIVDIVRRYKGRIETYDVINEAHEFANTLFYASIQLDELTKIAADAAKEADPSVERVVNTCMPFGEYSAGSSERRWPFRYLSDLIYSGIQFEAIGIQFYYGAGGNYCWDMLEISSLLDRYAELSKPIHITELGTPSKNSDDPKSFKIPIGPAGWWHKPWDEDTQAEWVEQFYIICLSKPYIEAITWWDLADIVGHFYPHGGFLRDDLSSKPSFDRVLSLKADIGL